MKLNAIKFGLAMAYVTGIVWVICALVVFALPGFSMNAGGYMMHADLSGVAWHMGVTGFLVGGILWIVIDGVCGWLFAWIYNRLVASE